jgi:SpoVK/Ycf46/Vps4 family AAA+-type ATPase
MGGHSALVVKDVAALQRADAAKEATFMENEHLAAYVKGLARQVALAAAAGLPPPPLPHVLFTGNPGTGKTSSARYLGHLLHKAGLLAQGQVKETTGEELVGSFVGQTKDKVRALLHPETFHYIAEPPEMRRRR